MTMPDDIRAEADAADPIDLDAVRAAHDDYQHRLEAHRDQHPGNDQRCDECRELAAEAAERVAARRDARASEPEEDMVDLLSSVDVDGPDELPTVGVFGSAPGSALFYPGQINGIHGLGGSLKTWLVYYIALQQVKDGHAAILFDYEVGKKRAAKRLARLGATKDDRHQIVWFRPGRLLPDRDKERLLRAVERTGCVPSFAPFDSVSRAMAGLSGNKGEDVNAWVDAVPAWVLQEWPEIAVALLDHVSKADADALMPTGAVQKFNAVQGAQYLVKKEKKPSKTEDGWVILKCAKDQEGNHVVEDVIAQFDFGPSNQRGLLQAPTGQAKADAKAAKKDARRDAIATALMFDPAKGESPVWLTAGELQKACGGAPAEHIAEREAMERDGELLTGKRASRKDGSRRLHYRLADPKAWITLG